MSWEALGVGLGPGLAMALPVCVMFAADSVVSGVGEEENLIKNVRGS